MGAGAGCSGHLHLCRFRAGDCTHSVSWPCLPMLSTLVQGFFGDMTSEDIGVPCPNGRTDCVESWFGTVTLSMMTLLQIMTLDSWVCHAGVIKQ